jgi:hypothetical protein
VVFTFVLVICVLAALCLPPLAVYLLWLTTVTRRSRPTVISGPWDFAALVAGLSGFILFGGALMLSVLQSNFRYWMRGNVEALRAAWGQERVLWSILAGAYALLVLTWVVLTVLARRRSLVFYNVEPAEFEATVTEVFDQLNRPVERRGNQWIGNVPLFELDRFEAGHTVTLRWVAEDPILFQEVERLLREAVRGLAPEQNGATAWLMAAALGTGLTACLGLLFGVYILR